VLDSGCTQQMTENRRMLTSIDGEGSECDKITISGNSRGKAKGLGKIAISNDLSISNVLLIESLSYNLLSVAQLCDLGLLCKFSHKDIGITSIKSDDLCNTPCYRKPNPSHYQIIRCQHGPKPISGNKKSSLDFKQL
jgi:hypothetical protein